MEDNWKRGTTLHPEPRFDRSHQKRGCATVTLMLIPVSWEQRKVHRSTKEGVKGKSLRLQWIYQHEWINGKEEIPLWGVSQCHNQQKLDSTSLFITSLNFTSLQVYEQEGGIKLCSKRKKKEGKTWWLQGSIIEFQKEISWGEKKISVIPWGLSAGQIMTIGLR